jgi:hypothetical protein
MGPCTDGQLASCVGQSHMDAWQQGETLCRIGSPQDKVLLALLTTLQACLGSDVGLWARQAPCRSVVSVNVRPNNCTDQQTSAILGCLNCAKVFCNVRPALSPDLTPTLRLDRCCEIMWVGRRITSSPVAHRKADRNLASVFSVDVTDHYNGQIAHGIQQTAASLAAAPYLGSCMLC